jgi:hypothetical protein
MSRITLWCLGTCALAGVVIAASTDAKHTPGAAMQVAAVQKAPSPAINPLTGRPVESPGCHITLANYSDLRSGMPYSTFENILGCPGSVASRVYMGGYATVMISWSSGGSTARRFSRHLTLINI